LEQKGAEAFLRQEMSRFRVYEIVPCIYATHTGSGSQRSPWAKTQFVKVKRQPRFAAGLTLCGYLIHQAVRVYGKQGAELYNDHTLQTNVRDMTFTVLFPPTINDQ